MNTAARRRAWGHARYWLTWVGLVLLGAWAFSLVWWWMLTPSPQAKPYEITIPRGTAAALESGVPFAFVPNAIALSGGRLIVRNEDTADHHIGNKTIPAGSVAEIVADKDEELTCTIHPSGYLGIKLDKKPGIESTIVPALLLGLPLGLALAGSISLARKIGVDHGPPGVAAGA